MNIMNQGFFQRLIKIEFTSRVRLKQMLYEKNKNRDIHRNLAHLSMITQTENPSPMKIKTFVEGMLLKPKGKEIEKKMERKKGR